MIWLLATETTSAPDWQNFAQYGVLGLVVLAFIFGKIVPGYVYERRVTEHYAAMEQNKQLEETIRERILPALIKSSDVMTETLTLLSEIDPPAARPKRRSTS